VPCKNYHGPVGCTRGEFCHFIHAVGYECNDNIISSIYFRKRNSERCVLKDQKRKHKEELLR